VLVLGLALFLFRRIAQDHEAPHWREETPRVPGEVGQIPAGVADAATH
jgi:hypothetical protein